MCPTTVTGAANHKLSHRLGDLPLLKGLGLPPEDHGLLPENQLLPPFGGTQPLPEDLPPLPHTGGTLLLPLKDQCIDLKS